jgi:hypothetical protein
MGDSGGVLMRDSIRGRRILAQRVGLPWIPPFLCGLGGALDRRGRLQAEGLMGRHSLQWGLHKICTFFH